MRELRNSAAIRGADRSRCCDGDDVESSLLVGLGTLFGQRRFARRQSEWPRITDAPRGTFVMRNTHVGYGLRRIRRGHSSTVSQPSAGGEGGWGVGVGGS
jgi:hypothetical protein